MTAIHSIIIFAVLNCYAIMEFADFSIFSVLFTVLGGLWFIVFNIFPSFKKQNSFKTKMLYGGTRILKVFLATAILSVILLFLLIFLFDFAVKDIIINSVIVVCCEFVLFWNGIIRVYCTSAQLGIKWRVLGIIFGMIPVIHLILLIKIISVTDREYKFELGKRQLEDKRKEQKVCDTKYPILLVHGVFFRDSNFFNYWGRIPETLISNGAKIYYGGQQSAASVEESAKELTEKIRTIINDTGCEKVNIIAHSKGGLDSRYAISCLGADKYTASLTTVNTPHKGCQFAEYLLNKVPDSFRQGVAVKYNKALKKLGDTDPDFLAAVNDLTASSCRDLNEKCPDSPEVFYQSIGSKMKKAYNGQFPLNLSSMFVKMFDGANDGLVSEASMKWGEKFTFLEPSGNRGISHGDVIDLNRENIEGFDVREFYEGVVHDLKERGF